jgi:hypothetical protein
MQAAMRPARRLAVRILALVLGMAVLASACISDELDRGYQGLLCSADPHDPFYACKEPFRCVSTYAERVRDADGGAPLELPVFVCRMPCQVRDECSRDEVCCEGLGPSGELVRTCVTERRCEALIRDR